MLRFSDFGLVKPLKLEMNTIFQHYIYKYRFIDTGTRMGIRLDTFVGQGRLSKSKVDKQDNNFFNNHNIHEKSHSSETFWKPAYFFTLQPRSEIDIEIQNFYCSCHPKCIFNNPAYKNITFSKPFFTNNISLKNF